jgi:tripartite-type tricarboxylate transporter receptor subunit TctC
LTIIAGPTSYRRTTMKFARDIARWLSGGAALLGCTLAAYGQTYPARAVRLVVPSSPGGGSDITARIIAPRLSEYLGQQVIVDNRAGAGTMIGGELVARAAPDGYTLLLGSTPMAINPAMYKKVSYDALRDFVPIAQIVSVPNLLIAHPSLPVKSVTELIAFAKSRPGQLTFASAGAGTSPHLSMELFLGMTGLKMIHVPYKGAGPGVLDVIAGHVALMTPTIISALGYVRGGRLRALGVTSAKRAAGAPEIPTIAEAGVPGYEATQWFGVLAPAGTPGDVVNLIQSGISRVLQQPDMKTRLSTDGADPVGSTPEEFAAFIRSETAKWAKVVKVAGVRID